MVWFKNGSHNFTFFSPKDCNSPTGYNLAVIIPFRDTTPKAVRVSGRQLDVFILEEILGNGF